MSSLVLDGSTGLTQAQPVSSIYCWGNGVTSPIRLPLPHSDTQIAQVSTGRTQKAGVTKTGRLIIWEVCDAQGILKGNQVSLSTLC